MTVSATSVSHRYKPGSARAAESLAAVDIDSLAALTVWHESAATGQRTQLLRDVHYALALGADGATITALGEWPADDVFDIARSTPRRQQRAFPPHQDLATREIERGLDDLTRQQQEQDELIGRGVRVRHGEAGLELPPVAARRNLPAGFDDSGRLGGIPHAALALALLPDLAPLTELVRKGDPGGNILAVGLFLTLSGLSIPGGTDLIQTSGFHTKGKGVARYMRWAAGQPFAPQPGAPTGAALPEWGRGYWWQEDATGAFWVLAESIPTSDQFGTVGDAARGADTSIATGTDVIVNLRKLARYAEHVGGNVMHLSAGGHRISRSWNLSDGRTYTTLHCFGVPTGWPQRHDSQSQFSCSAIYADRNDEPAVAVQATLGGLVENIMVEGPLRHFITSNGLGRSDQTSPAFNDAPEAAWQQPGALNGYGPFNSGAAVAVDPYSSAKPANAYNDDSYDDPAVGQYGKQLSSRVTFRNCYFSGFTVGGLVKPCDSNDNADYVTFPQCSGEALIYCLSYGNTQARNSGAPSSVWQVFHTFLTNRKHGKQKGNVQGDWSNINLGQGLNIVDIDFETSGPVSIPDLYIEGGWRIGNVRGRGHFSLANCSLTFQGSTESGNYVTRGLPMNLIGQAERADSAIPPVHLDISGELRVPQFAVFNLQHVTGDLDVRTRREDGFTAGQTYLAMAHDATMGGLVVSYQPFREHTLAMGGLFPMVNVVTPAIVGPVQFDGELIVSKRSQGVPYWSKALRTVSSSAPVPIRTVAGYTESAEFSARALNGRILTLTLDQLATRQDERNLNVGDVMVHNPSGAMGVIASSDAGTGKLIVKLFNGFRDDGGAISWPNGAPDFGSGYFVTFSGRYYIPGEPLRGNLTAGSPTITNCQRADGFAGGIDDVAVGDRVGGQEYTDYEIPFQATVAAKDKAAKTIPLSLAARATVQHRPLVFRQRGLEGNAAP